MAGSNLHHCSRTDHGCWAIWYKHTSIRGTRLCPCLCIRTGFDTSSPDQQKGAKKKGKPWATAKGFDQSAPCSDLHKVEEVGHIERGKITLSVNGEIRQ